MISSINVASRPPYSLGQETAPQPPSYNFFSQSTKYCLYSVGSSGKERSPSSHPFGRFSSNHVLNSSRKASSCFDIVRSEEHTSELQSRGHLVCRLLLEKKKHIEIRDKSEIHNACV